MVVVHNKPNSNDLEDKISKIIIVEGMEKQMYRKFMDNLERISNGCATDGVLVALTLLVYQLVSVLKLISLQIYIISIHVKIRTRF